MAYGDVTSEDYTKASELCSRQNKNPEKGNRGEDGGRGGNAGTPGARDIYFFVFIIILPKKRKIYILNF